MSDELRACPMCGGEPSRFDEYLDERNGYATRIHLSCKSCGVKLVRTGDASKGGYADNSNVESIIIAAWNRRADDRKPITTDPCNGMNCGCTDGVSHSPECLAQTAATYAGGYFVKAGAVVDEISDAEILRSVENFADDCVFASDPDGIVRDIRALIASAHPAPQPAPATGDEREALSDEHCYRLWDAVCQSHFSFAKQLPAFALAVLQASAAHRREPAPIEDVIACDFCGSQTSDPWHGSGAINGIESKHIHACDRCRHLLPAHRREDQRDVQLTDETILEISGRFIPNADRRARDSQVIDFARTILAAGNDGIHGDSSRLEWMAAREAWVAWGKDGESCRVFRHDEDGETMPIMGWKSPWFSSPREAIDAAMQRTAAPAQTDTEE